APMFWRSSDCVKTLIVFRAWVSKFCLNRAKHDCDFSFWSFRYLSVDEWTGSPLKNAPRSLIERGNQAFDPHDVQCPLDVVGQRRQAKLCSYFFPALSSKNVSDHSKT